MRKETVLTIKKKGDDYEIVIPAGTTHASFLEGIAVAIINDSEYQTRVKGEKVSHETILNLIKGYVAQCVKQIK